MVWQKKSGIDYITTTQSLIMTVELGPSHTMFHRDMTSLPRSILNCNGTVGFVSSQELTCKFKYGCKLEPGKLRSITKSVACRNPAAVWLGDSPIGMRSNCLASSISIDVLVAPVSKCAKICTVLNEWRLFGNLYTEAVETMTGMLNPSKINGRGEILNAILILLGNGEDV